LFKGIVAQSRVFLHKYPPETCRLQLWIDVLAKAQRTQSHLKLILGALCAFARIKTAPAFPDYSEKTKLVYQADSQESARRFHSGDRALQY
jgi:hypothetical protein